MNRRLSDREVREVRRLRKLGHGPGVIAHLMRIEGQEREIQKVIYEYLKGYEHVK